MDFSEDQTLFINYTSILDLFKNIHGDSDHPNILATLYQIASQKGKVGEHQTALEELEIILGYYYFLKKSLSHFISKSEKAFSLFICHSSQNS